MKGVVEIVLVAALGAGGLVLAYHYGARSEREWWRSELAAKSSAVRELLAKGEAEAEGFDRDLLNSIGDDLVKLKKTEGLIAEARNRPLAPQSLDAIAMQPPAAEPTNSSPGPAAANSCAPVPATCLQRAP